MYPGGVFFVSSPFFFPPQIDLGACFMPEFIHGSSVPLELIIERISPLTCM